MLSGIGSTSLKVCSMSFCVTSSFASEFNSSAKDLRGMGLLAASHSNCPPYP